MMEDSQLQQWRERQRQAGYHHAWIESTLSEDGRYIVYTQHVVDGEGNDTHSHPFTITPWGINLAEADVDTYVQYPQCGALWGSHGCHLTEGHDGVHFCGYGCIPAPDNPAMLYY
jgi:hypothetical protein